MKRIIGVVLLLCSAAFSARACDVCGCSAPGSYLGILPQFNSHFVGLRYQYQTFHSSHPAEGNEPAGHNSTDRFQSITAWGRYNAGRRWQLFAFVPYHYNTVTEGPETRVMNGIGDVQAMANYLLIDKTAGPDSNFKHTLLIGGGIKAPTGSNSFRNSEGIVLSNMQPGTGSWDFLANANYTVRRNKWGANVDASYRKPTVNGRDYLYGDKVSTGLSVFYWTQNRHKAAASWLPQAGMRYEWSGMDYSSHEYRIHNTYSGGSFLYATAGVGYYHGKMALTLTGALPVAAHYAGGLVTAGARGELQAQYIF